MNSTTSKYHRWALVTVLTSCVFAFTGTQAAEWGFTLIGHPSVQSSETEETVALSGSGSFDPDSGAASGGGSFTITNAEDEVELGIGGPTFDGTWTATQVLSFESQGGPNKGQQGGILHIEVLFTIVHGLKPEFKKDPLYNQFLGSLIIICPFDGTKFIEEEDAIIADLGGGEILDSNPTGFSVFHLRKP